MAKHKKTSNINEINRSIILELLEYDICSAKLKSTYKKVRECEELLKQKKDSIEELVSKEFEKFISPINEQLDYDKKITAWLVNYYDSKNVLRIAITEIGGKKIEDYKQLELELPLPDYLNKVKEFGKGKKYLATIDLYVANNLEDMA